MSEGDAITIKLESRGDLKNNRPGLYKAKYCELDGWKVATAINIDTPYVALNGLALNICQAVNIMAPMVLAFNGDLSQKDIKEKGFLLFYNPQILELSNDEERKTQQSLWDEKQIEEELKNTLEYMQYHKPSCIDYFQWSIHGSGSERLLGAVERCGELSHHKCIFFSPLAKMRRLLSVMHAKKMRLHNKALQYSDLEFSREKIENLYVESDSIANEIQKFGEEFEIVGEVYSDVGGTVRAKFCRVFPYSVLLLVVKSFKSIGSSKEWGKQIDIFRNKLYSLKCTDKGKQNPHLQPHISKTMFIIRVKNMENDYLNTETSPVNIFNDRSKKKIDFGSLPFLQGPNLDQAPIRNIDLSGTVMSFLCPQKTALIPCFYTSESYEIQAIESDVQNDAVDAIRIYHSGWVFETSEGDSYGGVDLRVSLVSDLKQRNKNNSLFHAEKLMEFNAKFRDSFYGEWNGQDLQNLEEVEKKQHALWKYPRSNDEFNPKEINGVSWLCCQVFQEGGVPTIHYAAAFTHNHYVLLSWSPQAYAGIDFHGAEHQLKSTSYQFVENMMSSVEIKLSEDAQRQLDELS